MMDEVLAKPLFYSEYELPHALDEWHRGGWHGENHLREAYRIGEWVLQEGLNSDLEEILRSILVACPLSYWRTKM